MGQRLLQIFRGRGDGRKIGVRLLSENNFRLSETNLITYLKALPFNAVIVYKGAVVAFQVDDDISLLLFD